MRDRLFDTIAHVTYAAIWVINKSFGLPIAILEFCRDKLRTMHADSGYFLMKRLDPTRCKAIEAEATSDPDELERQGMELKLMESSYKVRDHARETGEWTDHHTEAIEAVGTALVLDLGWDEESVHQHMKNVVESIDGLEFDGWIDED